MRVNMEKFLQRKDRFEFFESFENPLLNMTIRFECPNFMDFCKKKNIPAFQFFLFCISETIKKIDNFQYRTLGSEVIKVDKFLLSYTVLNQEGLFNYTDFEAPSSFQDFLKTSLDAKAISETTTELINTGHDASLKELKNQSTNLNLLIFLLLHGENSLFSIRKSCKCHSLFKLIMVL